MLARMVSSWQPACMLGAADSEESRRGSSLICLCSLFDFLVSKVGAHRKFVTVYFLVSNPEKQQVLFVIVYSFFFFWIVLYGVNTQYKASSKNM
jgi:hypothetical protein